MNRPIISVRGGMNTAQGITTSMAATMNASIISTDISEPSSPESTSFDDSDLLNSGVHDDVTAQLAAAGPIGVAAAAAIATGRKRKRPHSFETNPSIRKRQQTRLLRKLKNTIDEYTTRVGQQAVVVCCTPGKPSQSSQSFKVFGSQPLENVMRNCKNMVIQDLEAALAQQTPQAPPENATLHELPPLVIDGIPTPVDKMTQAQLRAFIPEMLKYSTGRSKPGWGKPECRPVWWPNDVPWANVRSDVRTEDEKKKVSWTHALRTIVKNCYKHHGREDLLPDFDESPHPGAHPRFAQHTMVQTINNPDGTVSIIHIDTGDVVNPQVVTLADGTQAHVVHTTQVPNGAPTGHEATHAVQTLAEVASNQGEGLVQHNVPVSVEVHHNDANSVATLAEATINQDGQLILTGDAAGLGAGDGTTGQAYHTGLVTIPVSVYQTVVTNLPPLGAIQPADQTHNIQVHMASPSPDSPDHPNQHVVAEPTALTQKPEVPDATTAVEVMTVEPS